MGQHGGGADGNDAKSFTRPSFSDSLPFLIVLLVVAHLLAFVYWIYRVATEKRPQRRKTQ